MNKTNVTHKQSVTLTLTRVISLYEVNLYICVLCVAQYHFNTRTINDLLQIKPTKGDNIWECDFIYIDPSTVGLHPPFIFIE